MRRLRIGDKRKKKEEERRRKKIETTAAKYNGLPIIMGSHNYVQEYRRQSQ